MEARQVAGEPIRCSAEALFRFRRGPAALRPGPAALPSMRMSRQECIQIAQMTLSSRIKPRQLQADAPALMIACGLAMRRFDPS